MKFISLKSKLEFKEQLTAKVYLLKYRLPDDFDFIPGQFMSIEIERLQRRAYSIVDFKDGLVSFLIDIGPGGLASIYFEKAQVGEEKIILGPYGLFKVKDTPFKKIFISTGTGIAPFIPMVYESLNRGLDTQVFFGIRHENEDIALPYFKDKIGDKLEYIRCVSKLEGASQDQFTQDGRVTAVLPKFVTNYRDSEFYICGNPAMVDDMVTILKEKGADKIYFEKY